MHFWTTTLRHLAYIISDILDEILARLATLGMEKEDQ